MDEKSYKHSNIIGNSWLRAKRIVFESPLNEDAEVRFVEEKIVNLGRGDLFHRDEDVLKAKIGVEQFSEEFELLDVVTGEPLGQKVSYGMIYTILKSAYFHFAEQRDNPQTVEESPKDPSETTGEI